MRILLVDDDALNAELFVEALADDGHTITVERDGPAGEERARREPFDLILLDIGLPLRSGTEVCRRLRAEGIRTRIIALSASIFPSQVAETVDAGFDRFLGKPISPAALRAAVRGETAEMPR
jgi:CheY-like chemotaxis protein